MLAAHGIATGHAHVRDVRLRQGWSDRLAPIRQALLANVIGADSVATHMSWGAVNEWLTHAGYTRLMQIEKHPTLDQVLSRIAAQETRHIAFYTTQARDRLRRSSRARRLTRFALSRAWQPVGANVMPRAEVEHLVRHLMSGEEGMNAADRIDAKVDTLPGMQGLGLVRRRTETLLTI